MIYVIFYDFTSLENGLSKFHHFTIVFHEFSRTRVIFYDFPNLENGLSNFQEFP